MAQAKQVFRVEVTDTFGGEANYCWVNRYKVEASSMLGAIGIVSRATGYRFRKEYDNGDFARYNATRNAVCAFVEWWDEAYHSQENYSKL